MPSNPLSPWRRHARAAFVLNPSPPRWPVALKAAATMLVVLGTAQVVGDLRLGMLASLGAFTVLYGPTTAARYRRRLMLGVATGLVAAAGLGALAAPMPVLGVLALAATATLASFACLTLRVGPPGAFFFVLVNGVGGLAALHGPPVAHVVAATIVGAAVAFAVGLSDLVRDPSRPQRLAVEAAESAMGRFEAEDRRGALEAVRHATSTALHHAWTVVTDAGSQPEWTTRLWSVQDRYVAATARITGGILGIDPAPWGPAGDEGPERREPAGVEAPAEIDAPGLPGEPTGTSAPGAGAPGSGADRGERARRIDVEQIRDTSLGRPGAAALLRRAARWPSEILLVAARVALASLVAGAIALALGGSHVYWAAAFATLVLHQGGTRESQIVRALQRLAGTAVGLLLFAALTALDPQGWALVLVVAGLQFVVELLIVRNYGFAVVAITPLALTIGSHAAARSDPGSLVVERGLDTVLAVTVALVVLAVSGRGHNVTLLRAYARDVVVGIDEVLADLATGRLETRAAREHRRLLYHALLESDQVARRTAAGRCQAV
ncbi:FUSC family protein [Agilicoccus flavus]|uniref:FUSC family protein n=1 Tax=Agilicoccus flavus TaxID=2775968 RepID=UPI001CF6E8CC|nr:FUSC family protein [Agilicoccus flavus]